MKYYDSRLIAREKKMLQQERSLTPAVLCRCLPFFFLHMLLGNEAQPPKRPGDVPAW